MEPFKCYTYKEAISNEMGFIRIQPQVYSRLINNLQRVGNLIYKYTLELKRDPRKTAQISEPPQGGKSLLKFLMLCCAQEAKLIDKREPSSRKLIRLHNGGVAILLVNVITYHNERVDATNIPIPIKTSDLFSTFLASLAFRKCQLCPCL